MKKLIAAICLLGTIAVSAQRPADAPKSSEYHFRKATQHELLPITKKDVVFLGNSITDSGLWSELFDSKRMKNRGISADKTYQVIERLDPIIKGQPKKVFILIGVNDIGNMDSQPSFVAENIGIIVDRFLDESPRTKVYVQSIMPVNDNVESNHKHRSKTAEIKQTNELIERLCAERGIIYIDLWPVLADEHGKLREEYTFDGLHVNGPGYIAWSDYIRKYVK